MLADGAGEGAGGSDGAGGGRTNWKPTERPLARDAAVGTVVEGDVGEAGVLAPAAWKAW